MSALVPSLALCTAASAGYVAKKIYDHEKRPLCKGSESIVVKNMAHPLFEAIVDNYVYIHNAFCNDLTRIIATCVSNTFVLKELEQWASILEVHFRFEDEVIIVALKARMKDLQQSTQLLTELTDGKDHNHVKNLLTSALECENNDKRISILKQLSVELEEHLDREETMFVPLLLSSFSLRELWAIDSFIINRNLGYCDKEILIKLPSGGSPI